MSDDSSTSTSEGFLYIAILIALVMGGFFAFDYGIKQGLLYIFGAIAFIFGFIVVGAFISQKAGILYLFVFPAIVGTGVMTWIERTAPPPDYSSCERSYDEASYRQARASYTWTKDPFGPDSIPKKTTSTYEVKVGMTADLFYTYCAVDMGVFSAACAPFSQCVMNVNSKREGGERYSDKLGFELVAKTLRQERIDSGQLQPSQGVDSGHAHNRPDRPLVSVKNFENACKAVSSTHRSVVVAGSIYQHVPEVLDWETALKLGEKAVAGYGKCHCVLSNFTGVEEKMSIGTCNGDKYRSY